MSAIMAGLPNTGRAAAAELWRGVLLGDDERGACRCARAAMRRGRRSFHWSWETRYPSKPMASTIARACRSVASVGEPLQLVEVLEAEALRRGFDEIARFQLRQPVGEIVDAHVEVAGDDAAAQRIRQDAGVAALVGVAAGKRHEQRGDALERLGRGRRVRASP